MPLRVCMVASRHTLDDARVVHREAASLRRAGHDVTFLFSCTAEHGYLRHDGQLLAQGRASDGAAVHDGFAVRGFVKRSGLPGKFQMYREAAAMAAALAPDVFHVHEPDLALAIALRATALMKRSGARPIVVHDFHEYPPGEWVDKAPPLIRHGVHLAHALWDAWTCRSIDHAFTANAIVRGYALLLNRHLPVDVLYNGPDTRLFPQQQREYSRAVREPFTIVHEGALSFDRGLREMVEVIDRLRPHVRLRIVGDVFGEARCWLDAEIQRRGLTDLIARTGWLSYREVGLALSSGDAGIILFRDCVENVLAGPPNKLFNYMNAGLPVLSVAFPEMRSVILETACGALIHDQSVDAIVGAISGILRLDSGALAVMGRAGQKAVRERYSWEVMESRMLAAYARFEQQARARN